MGVLFRWKIQLPGRTLVIIRGMKSFVDGCGDWEYDKNDFVLQ